MTNLSKLGSLKPSDVIKDAPAKRTPGTLKRVPHEKQFKVWKITRDQFLMVVCKELMAMSEHRLEAEKYIETYEMDMAMLDDHRPGYLVTLQMEMPETPELDNHSKAELLAYYNVAVSTLATAQARIEQLGTALKQKGII